MPHPAEGIARGDAGETPANETDSGLLQLPPASAKNMPKTATNLAALPKKEISLLEVSLVGDVSRAPDLDEVENLNRSGKGRSPMMTVIEAVVARNGGTIRLDDLAEQVEKYWNRPFPTSPYTKVELVSLVIGNSDKVRIS